MTSPMAATQAAAAVAMVVVATVAVTAAAAARGGVGDDKDNCKNQLKGVVATEMATDGDDNDKGNDTYTAIN